MAAVNLVKYKDEMLKAWEEVVDDRKTTDWALFTYDGQSNDLKLASKGGKNLFFGIFSQCNRRRNMWFLSSHVIPRLHKCIVGLLYSFYPSSNQALHSTDDLLYYWSDNYSLIIFWTLFFCRWGHQRVGRRLEQLQNHVWILSSQGSENWSSKILSYKLGMH